MGCCEEKVVKMLERILIQAPNFQDTKRTSLPYLWLACARAQRTGSSSRESLFHPGIDHQWLASNGCNLPLALVGNDKPIPKNIKI
jgi:hypothetical protein